MRAIISLRLPFVAVMIKRALEELQRDSSRLFIWRASASARCHNSAERRFEKEKERKKTRKQRFEQTGSRRLQQELESRKFIYYHHARARCSASLEADTPAAAAAAARKQTGLSVCAAPPAVQLGAAAAANADHLLLHWLAARRHLCNINRAAPLANSRAATLRFAPPSPSRLGRFEPEPKSEPHRGRLEQPFRARAP